jgi:mannose-1-phosphate guanylyltransferase
MKNNPVLKFPNSLTVKKSDRYAVILAGGDGSRLKSLTRAIAGDERPKQFCPILNNETLLDVTRKRVALKIAPENTFFSLTAKHERFYNPLLTGISKRQLTVQPENKGTAPAILYSLLHLVTQAPEATVAFFPSDHYFSDDEAFMNNVEAAFHSVEMNPDSLVLLGIEPESAETSYGWIEPRETLFGDLAKAVSQVKRFWEKPSLEAADYLMTKGCLWNSFVMVGRVGTFLKLIEKNLPGLYKMFAASSVTFGTGAEKATVRSLYAWIADANFSSEVLEKATDELYVLRVGDVVWSDWGEPQRVLGTLENLGLRPDWLRAVAA